MKKSDLMSMTVTELRALANKKKIALPSGAKKADIVKLLAGGAPKKKTAKTAAKRPAKAAPAKRKRAAKTGTKKRTQAAQPVPAKKQPVKGWKFPAGVEEPLMAQERIELAKYFTGGQAGPHPGYDDLPRGYGEDQIVLMARDPETVFAYWEATPAKLEQAKQRIGGGRLCIRLYDITGVRPGGIPTAYLDQEIEERIGSWYFNVGRSGRSLAAELGLRSPDGRFIAIARSNDIRIPGDRPSDETDREWSVTDAEFRRLYGVGTAPSSQEQAAGQWGKKGAVGGVSSAGVSSPGMFMRRTGKGRGNA